MHHPLPRLAIALLTGAVAVGALTACSSATRALPDTSPSVTPAPAPVGTPTPEASDAAPEPADDVLFTVAAKVRATDGTTVDLAVSGRAPLASTDDAATSLVDSFVDQCVALGGRSASDVDTGVSAAALEAFGSTILQLDLSSTPEGHTFAAPVDVELGSPYFARVVSGDNVQAVEPNDTCTGGYQLTGSGAGTALANFESGTPEPDLTQWTFGHYGFTVGADSGATIESCEVEVSDLAASAVADVPGWQFASDSTGLSCGIGYRGE